MPAVLQAAVHAWAALMASGRRLPELQGLQRRLHDLLHCQAAPCRCVALLSSLSLHDCQHQLSLRCIQGITLSGVDYLAHQDAMKAQASAMCLKQHMHVAACRVS